MITIPEWQFTIMLAVNVAVGAMIIGVFIGQALYLFDQRKRHGKK
jgi:hypothetical protein